MYDLTVPRPHRLAVSVGFVWCLLSAIAILPLSVPFPPLYDYHHWIFQGRIVADLLFSHPDSRASVSSIFSLRRTPIPNSASPVAIGLFSTFLDPEVAGRVFAGVAALSFAYGYASLSRAVQRRATAFEFLGLPWAFGYFLYKGYVSYLFSLSIAFFALSYLCRIHGRRPSRVSLVDVSVLVVLATLTYLSHLIGWIVIATAVALHAADWYRRPGRRREAIAVASSLIPSAALLAVYLLRQEASGGAELALYPHLWLSGNKLISLVEPFVLFLRPDPFITLVPTFWLNVVGFAAIGVALAVNVDRRQSTRKPVLVLLALALVLAALITPFSTAGGLARPDERLVFPGVLIGLTTIGMKRISAARAFICAASVVLILSFHYIEDRRVSGRSAHIDALIDATVPPDEPVLSLVLFDGPLNGGCDSRFSGPSIGAPTLRWFGLFQLMDNGRFDIDLLETSIVSRTREVGPRPDLFVAVRTPREFRGGNDLKPESGNFAFVEASGCADDLALIRDRYADTYDVVAATEGFEILRRR
jgi:hypothetical protein